jgi:hypothetical protein
MRVLFPTAAPRAVIDDMVSPEFRILSIFIRNFVETKKIESKILANVKRLV